MSWQTEQLGRNQVERAAPAAPEAQPTRSFGFQSGAARPGGMADQRFAEAVEAGKAWENRPLFGAVQVRQLLSE